MTHHDPNAFREFELQGWQKVAGRYHDTFAGVTVQCIPTLLDEAAVRDSTSVLDLACGPGYATAAAADRGARVLGVDFSSEMVAEAHYRFPHIDFQEGDAESLKLEGGTFDAVIMNFGMLHLGRPERAMSESYRVLRTGGRFAFTVWDTPDKTIGFGIVLGAIRKHGDLNVPIPPGPPFFRFGDPVESARALTAAGFSDIRTGIVPQIWHLATADSLFDIMMNASVRNAALLQAQQPSAMEAIQAEIREGVEGWRTDRGYDLPMPAVLTSGSRE